MHLPPAPLGMERGAAAGIGGREQGRADLGLQIVRGERTGDAVDDELAPRAIVEMLELATAADGEMLAGRALVVRARDHGALGGDPVPRRRQRDMAAVAGHPVAPARDTRDDIVVHRHSATASGIRPISASAMKAGPASRAARAWSQTAVSAA